MLTALLLCFGMGARAGNTVSITGSNGAPDAEVTVSVSMTNTDEVAAMQLVIPLDENLTFVEESESASERLAGLSLSAGVKDGSLNIMVFSTTLATIASSEGELLTFRLKLGDTPKDITLEPSRLTLTGVDGTELTSDSQVGTVSIRCAKAVYSTMTVDFGSVPIRSTYSRSVTVTNEGNEPLEVTGVMFSDPESFSTTTTLPLTVAAGQSAQLNVTYAPTVRGTVTKSVTVACNSISRLNTIQLKAQPFAVNELHVTEASGISDEEVTINLTMNNMDDIIGFQLDFLLPAVLEYVDGSFELNGDRKRDHVASTSINGQQLRIIGYSASGKAFIGNDGLLGSFRVKLVGRYGVTLKPSKTILTAFIDNQTINVASADYGGYVNIQSPKIYANSSLSFGQVPVTDDVERTFTIYNNGQVPLTVSRIVFADEQFSVKEELPLVIEASQNANVTVCNADKTEGDFSTTMNIYSNDPDQRVKAVSVTGNVFAPNYLTAAADDINTGEDVTLHVSISNYDDIEGIQFDITSTDEYTVGDECAVTTTRGDGITANVQQVDETTLRVVAYLLNGGSVAAGEGELFALKLTPVAELTEGTHQLTVSNVKLGTAGMVDKSATAATQTVQFLVQNITLGDVNGDGSIDILDIVTLVNYIIGKNPKVFVLAAADMNSDNSIDILDIVSLVNKIIGKD